MDDDTHFGYVDFMRQRLVRGMAQALAARSPARIRTGRIEDPAGPPTAGEPIAASATANRWAHRAPSGWTATCVGEGPEDNGLQVLLAEDLHGQPLGGLVNFACHTTVMAASQSTQPTTPGR